MSGENDNEPLPEDDIPAQFLDDPEIAREMAQLRAEAEAQKDRALRALAEVENVRKRLERARDDEKQYAVTRFARDLLSVADNLNRALASVPSDARTRADDSIRAVLDGVDATARELTAMLGRHGVKMIEAEGARFDPNLHQAIAEVPAPGFVPGTVVNVVQPGYVIGDRLLRAAMVTVAKAAGPGAPPPPPPNGAGGHFDSKV